MRSRFGGFVGKAPTRPNSVFLWRVKLIQCHLELFQQDGSEEYLDDAHDASLILNAIRGPKNRQLHLHIERGVSQSH